MKFDVTSKSLGGVAFAVLDQSIDVARKNVANSAKLYGIDPFDLEVTTSSDPSVSSHLDRYGEEWFVDSERVRELAPWVASKATA